MSSSATWSSMTVPPPSWTTSTLTASGSSTSDFATYSTRSTAAIWAPLLLLGRNDAGVAEQSEDGVGRLRALREPGAGLLGVDVDLDRFRPRVVVADRLDRAAVARGARVGDDHAVGRLLRRADARQPDPDCHGLLLPPELLGTVGGWG